MLRLALPLAGRCSPVTGTGKLWTATGPQVTPRTAQKTRAPGSPGASGAHLEYLPAARWMATATGVF